MYIIHHEKNYTMEKLTKATALVAMPGRPPQWLKVSSQKENQKTNTNRHIPGNKEKLMRLTSVCN